MGICFSFCDSKQKEGDKEGRRRFCYLQSHSDFILFPSNQLNSYQRRKLIMAAGTDQAHFCHQVADKSDFENQLKDAGSKLVVVDFFAIWCGPCRQIAPDLEKLAKAMSDVIFLKVDVDQIEELATENNITCMPTFVLFLEGKRVGEISGANINKLKDFIDEKNPK